MPRDRPTSSASHFVSAAFVCGLAMLSARDARGLQAAMDLDPARGPAIRLAPPAAGESLVLKRDLEFRSWRDRNPDPQAAPAGEIFDDLGLADAVGIIGARSPFGLVMRGAELILGNRRRYDLRQSAAADDGAENPGAAARGPGQQEGAKPGGVGDLLRNVDLKLGPVRWRAVLADEYRLQSAPGGQRTSGFVSSGSASAASYVFQPWFAQVRGGIGFVHSSVSDSQNKDSKSISLTGDAGLNLFPASRFPFEASFSVADSRAGGEITDSDFRTTRIGLRQAYRALDGSQYSARYDRSTISGAAFGSDVLNVVEGTYAKRFGAHAVEAGGNFSSNAGGVNGTQSSLTRFNGRHTYAPAANLQVETLATLNQNDFAQDTASVRNVFSTRFVQVAGFGSWRPVEGEPLFDENHPIVLTGGLRYSGIVSDSGGIATDNQSASASLGLNYTVGPATRLSASATVTQAVAASGSAGGGLTTSQNATLSHAPVPVPVGNFLYSWNLSGGASNSTGGGGAPAGTAPGVPSSSQSVVGQGGHNLSRNFQLAPGSSLMLSAGQSAGASLATGGGTQSLTHNGMAVWSLLGDSSAQAHVSVNLSDSRTFGQTRGSFQLINLQATRQAPTGPLSFWTANLTLQGWRQQLESSAPGVSASNSGGFTFSTTGSVAYQHLRFFGVPRLRMFASYTANQAQLQSRLLGDLDAPREVVTGALDARLDYQIGKVDTRLSFRTANVDRRRNTVLFLRVTRNF